MLGSCQQNAPERVEPETETNQNETDRERSLRYVTTTSIRRGVIIAKLDGHIRGKSVDIPLWLKIDEDLDDKCSVFTDVFITELFGSDIYVHQSNVLCTGDIQCRIVNSEGKFRVPKAGCIEPEYDALNHIEPLGYHTYRVFSSAEGVGSQSVIYYQPDTLREHYFTISPGSAGTETSVTYVAPETFLVRTPCPMPDGCEFNQGHGDPIKEYVWKKGTGFEAR